MAIIAVVGAGLVGRAWAIAFARGGHEVRIYDEVRGAAEEASQFGASALSALAEEDLLDGQTTADVSRRLKVVDSLAAALGGADHVQENTPEDLETKKRVFKQLDEAASPDAVLASSTSALLPSRFITIGDWPAALIRARVRSTMAGSVQGAGTISTAGTR